MRSRERDIPLQRCGRFFAYLVALSAGLAGLSIYNGRWDEALRLVPGMVIFGGLAWCARSTTATNQGPERGQGPDKPSDSLLARQGGPALSDEMGNELGEGRKPAAVQIQGPGSRKLRGAVRLKDKIQCSAPSLLWRVKFPIDFQERGKLGSKSRRRARWRPRWGSCHTC
jgi:hypothetical protein